MSYDLQNEYNMYQKNIMNLFHYLPADFKNDERKIQACNKVLNDYLAPRGLEVYLSSKPSRVSDLTDIDSPMSLTVKNLDIVKLLQKPSRINNLVIVNNKDHSVMFANTSHPAQPADVKLDITLKVPSGSAAAPVALGSDFQFKTLNANDLHVINEAFEQAIEFIQMSKPPEPITPIIAKGEQSPLSTASTSIEAKAQLPKHRREEFKVASERDEYVPTVKEAESTANRAGKERRALRKSGEKEKARREKYKMEVIEQKRLSLDDIAEEAKKPQKKQ